MTSKTFSNIVGKSSQIPQGKIVAISTGRSNRLIAAYLINHSLLSDVVDVDSTELVLEIQELRRGAFKTPPAPRNRLRLLRMN